MNNLQELSLEEMSHLRGGFTGGEQEESEK